MNSLEPVNELGYQYHCVQKNIDLIDIALKKKLIPSRLAHMKRVFNFGIYGISDILISVRRAATNGFKLLSEIHLYRKTGKLKEYVYRITRLLMLDPICTLSKILLTASRIICALIGIFLPRKAAKGIKTLEQVELFFLRVTWKVRDSLVLNKPTSVKRNIDPCLARCYLAKDLTKLAQDRAAIKKLYSSINAKFKEALQILQKIPKIIEECNRSLPILVLGNSSPLKDLQDVISEIDAGKKVEFFKVRKNQSSIENFLPLILENVRVTVKENNITKTDTPEHLDASGKYLEIRKIHTQLLEDCDLLEKALDPIGSIHVFRS